MNFFNILLLGQTGVGKSTFINAFTNYLEFENIDKAKSNINYFAIPFAWSFMDDDFQQKIIKCVENANECTDCAGQSATQQCRSYEFTTSRKNIRIIDTPGFGDTRGFEQDKVNAKHIAEYLKEFNQLHAICILLKPNESRLTASFEYYLREMICHLPRKAANNIVFMYTHTRGTFFKPGDTVIPLRSALKNVEASLPLVKIPYGKDNVFCVDNEAFRYLVFCQCEVEFSDIEFLNFKDSWETSAKELQRMIQYITHDKYTGMRKQLDLEGIKTKFKDMVQPLSQIILIIQKNLYNLAIAAVNINLANLHQIVDSFSTLNVDYQLEGNYKLSDSQHMIKCIIIKLRETNNSLIRYAAIIHTFLRKNSLLTFNDCLENVFATLIISEEQNIEIYFRLQLIKKMYQNEISEFSKNEQITLKTSSCAIDNINAIINLDCWNKSVLHFCFDQKKQGNNLSHAGV